MNKNNIWFITTKTNLHVGNENTNSYGLIDLAVQRNATTGLPCINSSSLKGALNEFASQFDLDRVYIFGSDKKDKSKESKKGNYTFFDADILFMPVQENNNQYHLETSHDILDRFRRQMELFNIKLNENDDALKEELKQLLKIEKEVKFSEEKDMSFIERCSDDNLPIIARNVLDNGESKNLWYEQVVPAETIFYTIIDDNGNRDKGEKDLANKLLAEDAVVQIGANATIGYGYCKFTNLK